MTDTVPRDVATTAPSALPESAAPPALPPEPPRRPAPDLPTWARELAATGWRRVLGWPGWVQVLVAYGASRVLCGVVIELAARWGQNPAGVGVLNPHYLDMVQIWDGEWFKKIALHGYPSTLPHGAIGTVDYNSWAFFPGFPMLVRLVMVTGLSFSVAASVVNLLTGAGAALVIWRLFSVRPGHERLAVLAVAFWCLLPSAPVLQVAYAEALAALLLAGTLLLLIRRHYLWAAPVVLALGLTRGIAAPLVVVVLWHGWLRWRARLDDPWPGRQQASWAVLLLATGVSVLLWPAVVGIVTGVPDAFLQTQAAWGQKPADGPFLPWLTWAWAGLGLVGVVLLLGVVFAGARLLTSRHTAWLASELRVFGVAYPVYLLAVVRPITSMWRFLLLDLPIAAALASVAARGAREHVSRDWYWRVAAAAAVALTAMCWWTAVYLTRIPWGDSPP
ncbi:hypothetical protein ACPPVT_00325 [Angustibacter sp. McL0619]|uniref:hypothetical protein n=1 Tax=Angustibacter sp. McL0619 TaxID=3415676 RepID=UPI003CF29FFB